MSQTSEMICEDIKKIFDELCTINAKIKKNEIKIKNTLQMTKVSLENKIKEIDDKLIDHHVCLITKPIVNNPHKCPICEGYGKSLGHAECRSCKGKGYVWKQ